MSSTLKGYADGGSAPNPGKGGWGAMFEKDGLVFVSRGQKNHTTNNEMELTGAINLFKILPIPFEGELFFDSSYVIGGLVKRRGVRVTKVDGWSLKWKTEGWKDRPNLSLWKELVEECERHVVDGSTFTINWVKGHDGNFGNEVVDKLANPKLSIDDVGKFITSR